MDTGKAFIAGLVITIGLLAVSYGIEGVAQLAGPEEVEVHAEEEKEPQGAKAGEKEEGKPEDKAKAEKEHEED